MIIHDPPTLPIRSGGTIISAFQGVCFDLFSTLVHRTPDNPFFRHVAKDLDLDLETWKPAYDKLHDETMEGVVPGIVGRISLSATIAGTPCSTQAVHAAVERHFPGMAASFEVDPQATPLLDQLREQGCSLALVSNASDHAEWIFDHLGLREYFDATVFSHRVKRLKPHPDIYLHAIDELGIAGPSCAFIGDGQHHELLGARGVGMTTILIDRRLPHSDAARAEADTVVDDLAGVPDALTEMSAARELLRK
ncbi:HAD family hydrolase [Streptomyces pinistramenti]|uniref:HAD family hydrolase n=1 Tax=Streptomyces pinistramenti TaxID=2884812 RepID=UPI001D089D0F|nr:HAD family hydrolase [Streptomyces pinistramenti]MCB5910434.1 HAD family hydrolase [Streptomyces pinistramenti]